MNATRARTFLQACAVAAFIAVCVVVELADYRLPRGHEHWDQLDHTTPVRHGPLPSPGLQLSTFLMSSRIVSTHVYCPLCAATTVVCR